METSFNENEALNDLLSFPTDDKLSSLSYEDRLNKIVNIRLEKRKGALDAFNELSTFFKENTINSRRTLRYMVEKRSIEIVEKFLSETKNAKNSIDSIRNDALEINDSINSMISWLKQTNTKTQELRSSTNKLLLDRKKICMQELILSKFMEKFQLPERDFEMLKQSDVTNDFFLALNKAHTIHTDCQILFQSGGQALALSIMEQMSLLQETAMEYLYRWTQIHCKDIESPRIAPLLAKAMKHFENRSVLFSNLISEYSAARRAVMVRMFIDALTKGGPQGMPRPIESYANDKKRYVGDMLTWLRQYIPIEKENMHTFLEYCDTSRTDVENEMNRGLSYISEGVCSPLAVRIENIMSSVPSPFELYDTFSLLKFYTNVILEELPKSSLGTTLKELTDTTENAFFSSIQNFVNHVILEKMDSPEPDLSPSRCVSYLLNFMSELLSVAVFNEGREKFTVKIIGCVVEPLLKAVYLSTSRLTATDMAVYLLNCIHEIIGTLSLYEFVDEWFERLNAQAEAQLDTLTSEQASSLVVNLNLSSIYTVIQRINSDPLSQVPCVNADSLKNFVIKLESFLNAPHSIVLPQINYLTNSHYRNEIKRRANEVIIAVYTQLYTFVNDPANLYENPVALLPRPPDQIKSILLAQVTDD